MEGFSQSRGDDDLFEDEIIPIENPPPEEQLVTQIEQVSLEPLTAPPSIETILAAVPAPKNAPSFAKTLTSTEQPFPGFRQTPVGGRGGILSAREGARKASGLEDSKWAAKPAASKQSLQYPAKETSASNPTSKQTQPQPPTRTDITLSEEIPHPTAGDSNSTPTNSSIPTGPSQPQNKTPAVRGDRTLTGGAPRSKLTEEELTAKLAAAKERSQTLSAAHARAQADAANFEERERIASQKRVVERVERRKMEGERERNRLRKLGNRGGREWDRDKEEMDSNGRGGRRGFENRGGPPEDDDLRQYEWHEDLGRGGGRGRGGRGGRGRGRGGFRGGYEGNGMIQQPDVSAETDFPALPGSTYTAPPAKVESIVTEGRAKPSPRRLGSADGGRGTWAEQVESSELDGYMRASRK